MTARFPLTRVPEPRERAGRLEGLGESIRVVNQNFRALRDQIERAILGGGGGLIPAGSITLTHLAAATKQLVGDVTGTIGSTGSTTVERIRGANVPTPGASEDDKLLRYDHGGTAFTWESLSELLDDILTTSGDLLYRSGGVIDRLPLGSANAVLAVNSGGTAPAYSGLSALLDAVFSNTQGSVLYRGASAWAALGPGTSGHFLKTQGAGADPIWDAAGGGGSATKQAIRYTFSTTTTDADPGSGTLRFNNATPASVTAIYIDDLALGLGVDIGAILQNLMPEDRIYIVQEDDDTKGLVAKVTARATDNTGYWTIPVTVDSAGTLPDNAGVLALVIVPRNNTGFMPLLKSVTTTTYTVTAADDGYIIQFTNSSGCTVTMPLASVRPMRVWFVNAAAANNLVLNASGSDTIDFARVPTSATSFTIGPRSPAYGFTNMVGSTVWTCWDITLVNMVQESITSGSLAGTEEFYVRLASETWRYLTLDELEAYLSASGSSHNLLSATHPDTTAGSPAQGDLITGQVSGSTTWTKLALGTNNFFLGAHNGDLKYQDPKRYNTPSWYCWYLRFSFPYGIAVTTGNQGGGRAAAASGTIADANDTTRAASNFANATTTSVGWSVANPADVEARHSPHMRFDIRIANLGDGCLWAGFLATTSLTVNTADPAVACAAFRVLNGTDTNFIACTHDGTTLQTTDTGIAADNAWHDLEVFSDDGGTTWYFYIDGVLVATHSTNVPGGSTKMLPRVRLASVTSSSRTITCSYGNILLNARPSII